MISQLFILSLRGEVVLKRDFRGEIPSTSNEEFFRRFKESNDLPPVFYIGRINYLYMMREALIFVCTSLENICPTYAFELVLSIIKTIKDYCGAVSEDVLRKNFVLIYELIDEIVDFGYAQIVGSEHLEPFIFNQALLLDNSIRKMYGGVGLHEKPVAEKLKKPEIFVDVVEKITALFYSNGYVMNSSIEGLVQMKCFVSKGAEIELGFDTTSPFTRSESPGSGLIEDFNFHFSVDHSCFLQDRVLTISPPIGEFTACNYRGKGEVQLPLRVYHYIEKLKGDKFELVLKVKNLISRKLFASDITVKLVLPNYASAHFEKVPSGQELDFDQPSGLVMWRISKIKGDEEVMLRLIIRSSKGIQPKEIHEITMGFHIPNYCSSGIKIKYLKMLSLEKVVPAKWIRYTTSSNSYIFRL